MNLFRLDGKVALVTGASKGLGRSMARALAEAGADVAGVARGDLSAVAADVISHGKRFAPINCDLSVEGAPAGAVSAAVAAFGRLDILVNNAGAIQRQDALEVTADAWDAVIDLNLRSVFFLAQAAARQFVAQGDGGKIINVASLLSFQGGIRVAAYTSAKSGVVGLTRILANEWASRGINVNAVAPGYMVTDNTAALRADPQRNAAILERIPAGRWGEPHDLDGAVVFLASSASDYVHGTAVVVDGGWLGR